MPISDRQLAANRSNAAKSTGPRSPEGKSRSAQNARAHGFTASTFAVVRIEDINEVAHLTEDLVALYRPENSQEQFALERMALTQQSMLRAARLEAGLFTACLDVALNDNGTPWVGMSAALAGDGDIEITRGQNRTYAMGEGFNRMVRQPDGWKLFLRYQAQSERLYRRAVEEFDRVKALRTELRNEPAAGPQPEENEPPSTPRNEPISPQPTPNQLTSKLTPPETLPYTVTCRPTRRARRNRIRPRLWNQKLKMFSRVYHTAQLPGRE